MNLDKLLGSKTKVDIIKYLLFKRQGISMRALENELEWTFPAIKKQIDSLCDAEVIEIDKSSVKRSIKLKHNFFKLIENVFLYSLKNEIIELFDKYNGTIQKYYLGQKFGISLDMDLIVLYNHEKKDQIDKIKNEINKIFSGYFIDVVSVVFMSSSEREKRYRLADRFVLNIIRSLQNQK